MTKICNSPFLECSNYSDFETDLCNECINISFIFQDFFKCWIFKNIQNEKVLFWQLRENIDNCNITLDSIVEDFLERNNIKCDSHCYISLEKNFERGVMESIQWIKDKN